MNTPSKRTFLLGAAGTLVGGCGTLNEEQCDPRRAGSLYYFCDRQQGARIAQREDRVGGLTAEVNAREAERRRLREEAERLRLENLDISRRTRQLEADYRQLESALPRLRGRRAPIGDYVTQLRSLLEHMGAGVDTALAFNPPQSLVTDGALLRRYHRARHDAQTARRELNAMHAELARVWAQFLGGQLAENAVRDILERIVRRLGWRALNPAIALAALINEVWGALNAAYDSWDIYN